MTMTMQQIFNLKKDVVVLESEVPSRQTFCLEMNRQAKKSFKNYESKITPAVAHVKVKKTCNYCHKPYTYNYLVGDCNLGACSKPRCVLQSMRDHM